MPNLLVIHDMNDYHSPRPNEPDWAPSASGGRYWKIRRNSKVPPAARRTWLDGYVRTYLERDFQALSAIGDLVDFRRLMRVEALRSGTLVNRSEIARDAGLSQSTAPRYLNLLETSYLLHRLPAYAVNRSKRIIKTPRLFFCDTDSCRLFGWSGAIVGSSRTV